MGRVECFSLALVVSLSHASKSEYDGFPGHSLLADSWALLDEGIQKQSCVALISRLISDTFISNRRHCRVNSSSIFSIVVIN
jgi:hypothetical protein